MDEEGDEEGFMQGHLNRISWDKERLWKGCTAASIAHAIMVATYPEIANEHSWDGMNYSTQDSAGARGTITFCQDFYIAAFRDDNSKRLCGGDRKEYQNHLVGAPDRIVEVAKEEALQYLLLDVKGHPVPVITTAFWGNETEAFSNDSLEEIRDNGGFLIERQLLDMREALDSWREYYDMTEQQYQLLTDISRRKVEEPNQLLILSKEEIERIGIADEDGLAESRASFYEMGIHWQEQVDEQDSSR